jgi:hypothetical protein
MQQQSYLELAHTGRCSLSFMALDVWVLLEEVREEIKRKVY